MDRELTADTIMAPPGRFDRLERRLITIRRELRRNPNMILGIFIVLLAASTAIFAPVIADKNPKELRVLNRLQAPSTTNYMGTDGLGRDVFSRAVHGTRLSLLVGIMVAIISMAIGTAIGVVTGYYRALDNIVMRLMDGLMAFPSFLLAIALVSIMGASITTVITAITVVETPRVVRLVRASVLTLREREYVDAARAIGALPLRIMWRHVFPNLIAPILVQGTFVFALAILVEAGLSFLGTGIPPDVPTWGNMMGEGKLFFRLAVWIMFFPGLMLSITVLGVNLVGDGLRDTLDPRLRRAR